MIKIRSPFVSGRFYPNDKKSLGEEIEKYIKGDVLNSGGEKIRAMIVPHASYYYSGRTAGYAYREIKNSYYKRVFLIGDSHSSRFSGIAGSSFDYWESPLGRVRVDKALLDELKRSNSFSLNDEAHEEDHILEVQIPFLQKSIAEEFTIIPLSVGKVSEDEIEELTLFLKEKITEDDLIIVSCDLSHYPEGVHANKIDQKTINLIAKNDLEGLKSHVDKTMSSNIPGEETLLCSYDSVKMLMSLSNKMKWNGKVLNYLNSGDISGDLNSVVGYGSLIFK